VESGGSLFSSVVAREGVLSGVDGFGWDGVRVAVVAHDQLPVAVVDEAVAFSADQREVVQVGAAAVFPESDVVGLAPLGWAAAHDAAGVADGQGDALVVAGESGGSSEREWYAVVVDDDGGQVGVAGDEFGEEATDGAGPVEVERPVGVARLGRRLPPGAMITGSITARSCFDASISVARHGHRLLPDTMTAGTITARLGRRRRPTITTTSGCAASSDIAWGSAIRRRASATAEVFVFMTHSVAARTDTVAVGTATRSTVGSRIGSLR
jgi:hypothetical protein